MFLRFFEAAFGIWLVEWKVYPSTSETFFVFSFFLASLSHLQKQGVTKRDPRFPLAPPKALASARARFRPGSLGSPGLGLRGECATLAPPGRSVCGSRVPRGCTRKTSCCCPLLAVKGNLSLEVCVMLTPYQSRTNQVINRGCPTGLGEMFAMLSPYQPTSLLIRGCFSQGLLGNHLSIRSQRYVQSSCTLVTF